MNVTFALRADEEGFANTMIAFTTNGGEPELFAADCGAHPAQLLFFMEMAERCPPHNALTFFSAQTSATDIFEKQWIIGYAKDNFRTKPDSFREELKTLAGLLTEKDLTFEFKRIAKQDKSALRAHIQYVRVGRKKQAPHVPSPGDPDDNIWSRDRETISDRIRRAIAKDP